jgi:2,4-dienoyl-CoA reductase-like NADH-dependent reductase (Old Yellow Enzyme family)
MADLFSPLSLRGVTFRNRIGVSPMCMYAIQDGLANDWHFVHLGSRAVGGAGLVMVEASGVEARGRISPADMGIWSDAHGEALAPIAAFIARHGAVPGIQIAHAGRKASVTTPWQGDCTIPIEEGGWETIGPSAIPFDQPGGPVWHRPRAMTEADIAEVIDAFAAAAGRADRAGFEVLEIHAAHGYLLHSFLSPLSNRRADRYGGSFENRCRLMIEVTRAARAAWPERKPLFARISAVDWKEGGWTIEDSVELARRLKGEGVDLIDASSGYTVPDEKIDYRPGFQAPFAERIRREAGIATAAVGLITEPAQADAIIRDGQADMVLLGTAMLHDPYWAFHAARALGRLDRMAMPASYDYVVRPRANP